MEEKTTSEEAKEKEITIEQGFEMLETLLLKLEDRTVSLEDSFRLYQEGMACLKAVNQRIERVEKEVLVLDEEGGFTGETLHE